MFSIRQKREIADAVQKILRETLKAFVAEMVAEMKVRASGKG